jgi:dienelactone hydrolase
MSRRMLMAALAATVAVLPAAGCGGSSSAKAPPPLPASAARVFDYDRSAQRDRPLHDVRVVNHGYPVKIHDVWYEGPGHDRVEGYLMIPPGKGPFAGVVFVPGAGGTRDTWLIQAADLAARGAVTFALSLPFIENQPMPGGLGPIYQYRIGFVESVLDIRRALDLLAARHDVDPQRLGIVGHSLGGGVVAATAGADKRPAAVVLMAPVGRPHFYPPLPRSLQPEADQELYAVVPTRYIRYARPALLLALARHDQVISKSEYDAYQHSVPAGTTVRWYDTSHTFDASSTGDMLDWLAGELHLGPLPAYAHHLVAG